MKPYKFGVAQQLVSSSALVNFNHRNPTFSWEYPPYCYCVQIPCGSDTGKPVRCTNDLLYTSGTPTDRYMVRWGQAISPERLAWTLWNQLASITAYFDDLPFTMFFSMKRKRKMRPLMELTHEECCIHPLEQSIQPRESSEARCGILSGTMCHEGRFHTVFYTIGSSSIYYS
jgi:hypothetical protein